MRTATRREASVREKAAWVGRRGKQPAQQGANHDYSHAGKPCAPGTPLHPPPIEPKGPAAPVGRVVLGAPVAAWLCASTRRAFPGPEVQGGAGQCTTCSCTRARQPTECANPWSLLHEARLRRGVAEAVSTPRVVAQSPLTGTEGGRAPMAGGLTLKACCCCCCCCCSRCCSCWSWPYWPRGCIARR